ncbi:hypothetical protein GHK86_10155, partial [Acidimicrobiaceae bacterium USS-CC1]|nr:hypothetical protein [Acidiferrimicrobium australe]
MSEAPCRFCGREAIPGRPYCSPCNRGVGRSRGRCGACAADDRFLYDRLCYRCRQNADRRCQRCGRAIPIGSVRGEHGEVICGPCGLRHALDEVLPAGGVLDPLRPAILAAEPLTTGRWLKRSRQLLAAVHNGRVPLDHEALDTLGHPRSVEYLRALMISAGILPPDTGRDLRRLERDLPDLLAAVAGQDRKAVTSWVRWAVLHRLRRLDPGRLALAVSNDRRKIRQVTAFTATLAEQGRCLSTCTQADLDTWFAGPGAARWSLRPFLAWAARRHHLPARLELPRAYKAAPSTPIDAEQRWAIAHRLVTDTTLSPADRVAGALVVLYAQPLNRIARLTTDHVAVHDDHVELHLGPDPLVLPEPFATLISSLPRRRRQGTAEQLTTTWLFPGGHASQPLTANALG